MAFGHSPISHLGELHMPQNRAAHVAHSSGVVHASSLLTQTN